MEKISILYNSNDSEVNFTCKWFWKYFNWWYQPLFIYWWFFWKSKPLGNSVLPCSQIVHDEILTIVVGWLCDFDCYLDSTADNIWGLEDMHVCREGIDNGTGVLVRQRFQNIYIQNQFWCAALAFCLTHFHFDCFFAISINILWLFRISIFIP